MANPKLFIPMLQQLEGGWSNHPADRGGATMCGITYKTFCGWRSRKKQPQPSIDELRNITQEEWADIFIDLYWKKWKADLIHNQSIANILRASLTTIYTYRSKLKARAISKDDFEAQVKAIDG